MIKVIFIIMSLMSCTAATNQLKIDLKKQKGDLTRVVF